MGLTQKLGTIPLAISTDASNNVGIGGSPSGSYKLEVTGTAKVSSTLLVSGTLTGSAVATFTAAANPLILKSTSATTGYTEYYYNTSTLAGIIGNGGGILTGANNSDFIVRSEADFVVATGGNNRRLTIASTGAATFSSSVNIGASATTGKQLIVNQTGASGYFLSGEASGTEIAYWYYNATEIQFASKAAARALTFLTTDVERMRITSGGVVTVNQALATYGAMAVKGNTDGATYGGLNVYNATGINFMSIAINTTRAVIGVDYAAGGSYMPLCFETGNTERMRITSGGAVQINTTLGTATLNLKTQSSGAMIKCINAANGDGTIYGYGTSTSFDYAFNTYSVANAFYLYNNGNYDFAGSDVSDLRLKENIKTIDYNATEKLMQLIPKSYNMIKHPDIKRSGFIAQEVQQVLPDFISGEETETDYLGVDYNGILALAVKAIQELSAQNQDLKSRLDKAGL